MDTSVLVAAIGGESWPENVREWLAERHERLAVSGWCVTEFSSAIAQKVRSRVFTPPQQRSSLVAFERLQRSLHRVEVRESDYTEAARMADRYESGLRGPDALHLAVARRLGCRVVTLDRGMEDAAAKFGIPVYMVGNSVD